MNKQNDLTAITENCWTNSKPTLTYGRNPPQTKSPLKILSAITRATTICGGHWRLLFLHGVTLHQLTSDPRTLRQNPCTWEFFNGYSLFTPTPCSEVLLEKLTAPRLARKFIAFYGSWRFVTVFTSAGHLSSQSTPIQPMSTEPASWRSI